MSTISHENVAPQKKPPKSFAQKNWKLLICCAIAVVLLITAALLVLFLVILKPKDHGTTPTTVAPMGSTTKKSSTKTNLNTTKKMSTTTRKLVTGTVTTNTPPTPDPNAICIPGFTLVGHKCWKLIDSKNYRGKANNVCLSNNGSTLVTIKNSYENDALANFVSNQNVTKIWMGLKCEGHDGSSCKWDYGQGSLGDYSNFADGSPNVTIADCIYYSVTSNQWVSRACSDKSINIVCELPTTKQDSCVNNYANNCYIPINQAMLWDDATQECAKNCGTLLTIQSNLENRYVQSITSKPMLLGCVAASSDFVRCIDRDPMPYTHLKNFTEDYNCIFYDSNDGYWTTDRCDMPMDFYCKRPVGKVC